MKTKLVFTALIIIAVAGVIAFMQSYVSASDTVVIGAATDDAYDRTSWCTTDSAKIGKVGTETITTGYRFTGISKPAGSSGAAEVKLWLKASASESTSHIVTIYFEDTAAPATFGCTGTGNDKPSQRTKTTASVSWPIPAWVKDGSYESADITAAFNEAIGNVGWAGVVAVLIDGGSTVALKDPYTYEDGVGNAPQLVITWNATVTPTPTNTPTATNTPVGTDTPTATPTANWTTTNDGAVYGDWTGKSEADEASCDIVLDTTTYYEGTGSYKFDKKSQNGTACSVYKQAGANYDYHRISFMFRFSANPEDTNYILWLMDNANTVYNLQLWLTSSGEFQVRDTANTTTYSTGYHPSANTWYRIEFVVYNADAPNGYFNVKVNGNSVYFKDGIDTKNGNSGGHITIGHNYTTSVSDDIWIDDVKWWYGAAAFEATPTPTSTPTPTVMPTNTPTATPTNVVSTVVATDEGYIAPMTNTPTYTPTDTPTSTITPTTTDTPTPTVTPTASSTPTPTITPTPSNLIVLNEIDNIGLVDITSDGIIDIEDTCIELATDYSSLSIAGWKIVSILDSGRYTYTIPYGSYIYFGAKAFSYRQTLLPLSTTDSIRAVELYNLAGTLIDTREYETTAATTDKRVPDITGSWSRTAWSNCGRFNSASTPTPTATPTYTVTPTATAI